MQALRTQNRYMQIGGFAEPVDKTPDLEPLLITPKAAWPMTASATPENYTTLTNVTEVSRAANSK
jgi:hypothetical protein